MQQLVRMNPRKLIRLFLFTRDLRSALYAWRNDIAWFQLERRGKTIVLKGTDLPYEYLPSPLPGQFYYHVSLLLSFGFKFGVADNGGKSTAFVDTGEVKLWLDGGDEIYVVEEVFADLEYGAPISEPATVIDIGMNVAAVALYFAKEQLVKRVIGFEPFSEATKRAERNLAINPQIAPKIEIRRYALGDFNGNAHLRVDPELSVLNEIVRDPDPGQQTSQLQAVEIRDAETELQSVLAETDKSERVVLKVDCEGSEREIFQRLSGETLSRIDTILLEWHHADILDAIRQKLQKHDFQLLVKRNGRPNRGMLYAFRK
jgi:FkbM family methyltransferase